MMQPNRLKRRPLFRARRALPLMFCLCFAAGVCLAAPPQMTGASPSAPPPASEAEKSVTIDFNDVDINVLIKFISELTGKNFIIDNRVRGKVTIMSPAKISVAEAYRVFESVLEVNGFATVPAGKVTKIVPSPDARSKNIETRLKAEGTARITDPADKLVTQLIPLTYADAGEVKRLFTPLVSKNSVLLSYGDTNTLIVTDASSNIKRLMDIISAIDVPGIGREVTVIPLQYADADKLVKTLSSIFRPTTKGEQGVTERPLQFVSDQRTNAIIFLASEDDAFRVKQLIALLDQDTPRDKGKIRVFYLEHATAEEMAKVLQDLPTKTTTGDKGKDGPFVSEKISITADKATNSLIIMADGEDYLVIEEIIKKLDIPRSMVYIESLIMEVNVDKGFDLGVEWSAFGTTSVDGNQGVVGGSFSGSGGLDVASLATGTGMSMGIVTGGVDVTLPGGTTMTLPNLGAIIKALESSEDVHILSTPQILTTDNEEATIIVGRNVAFQTKTSTSDNDTYNSYEYRDVGLTLKITPHISKDRMVRLKISQELTALTGTSEVLTNTPTTLKRSVDTTVIVQDQNMLVIGGLIDDNITNTVTKVPVLGSIPILGRLFRSESKSNNKTNLYIFITPRVVNNPAEAKALLGEKEQSMSPVESGLVKLYGPKSKPPTDQSTGAPERADDTNAAHENH